MGNGIFLEHLPNWGLEFFTFLFCSLFEHSHGIHCLHIGQLASGSLGKISSEVANYSKFADGGSWYFRLVSCDALDVNVTKPAFMSINCLTAVANLINILRL